MFVTTQQVPYDVAEVFAWHGRPGAFARLSPPWQPASLVAEADSLRSGEAVLGFPARRRWVATHLPEAFEPDRHFADELTSRPFVVPIRWRHDHAFAPGTAPDGSPMTTITDTVRTTLPARFLSPIFAYRHRQLADDLIAHAWSRALHPEPLTVAITGASGMVGTALSAFLSTGGHRVIRLVRGNAPGPDERVWNPTNPDPRILAGVDAVVHLAGASIAGRFTSEHKKAIRESRIEPTRRLAEAAAAAGVRVFVSASAIGYYGPDADRPVIETDPAGGGFLADVVTDWEASTVPAAAHGARVVTVRTGIVQSPAGGALRLQRPLFAAGLGGRLGSGEQWLSWIAIDDLLDVYLRALVDDRLVGPVNAVAPHPVQGREYAATLARALHRPALVPTPALGPTLLLGREGAQEVALASQRVLPSVLGEVGHRFRFDSLEPALRHLLGTAR